MASPRFHSVRSPQAVGRQRRPTRHAGRPARAGARRQCRRRGHRDERSDRGHRTASVRHGRRPLRARASRRRGVRARTPRDEPAPAPTPPRCAPKAMTEMPFRHDIRSVTVPGCVDGWMALHERFGTLPLSLLFEPAIALAADGFPASPLLVGAGARADEGAGENLAAAHRPAHAARCPGHPPRCCPCACCTSPRVAATRSTRASSGRD